MQIFFPLSTCVSFCLPSQFPPQQYTGSSHPLNVQLLLLHASYALWSSRGGWQELWREQGTGGNEHQQHHQDLNPVLLEQKEGVVSALILFPLHWYHWGQDGVSHGHTGNYSYVSLHHPPRCDTLPSAARSVRWVHRHRGVRCDCAAGNGDNLVFHLWISVWAVTSILPGM